MTLTPAQIRALAWLPADGTWRMDFDIDGMLQSMAWPLSTIEEKPRIEAIGGRLGMRWFRLTPAGQAERARLVKEGRIE